MEKIELYLTRHGQSGWQVEGDSAGHNSPLSPLGRQQAERLGRWLAEESGIPVARLLVSPLIRARQTAEPVAAAFGLGPLVVDSLREADFFVMEHLPVHERPGVAVPNGWQPSPEYAAFRQQASDALARLVAEAEEAGAPVLAVAHGGLIGTLLRLVMGSDTIGFWAYNTSLTKVVWQDGRWHLRYLNRLDHLPAAMRTA